MAPGVAPRAWKPGLPGGPTAPRDWLRWSLFLLIVLNISRLHQQYGFVGVFKPATILTGVAILALLANTRQAAPGWTKYTTTKLVIGITLVALGSVAFGISQGGAYYFFSSNFSKVLVGAFLLMAVVREPRDIWFFAWAYVIGCAFLVQQAIFVAQLEQTISIARLDDFVNWDANDLGLLLLIGVPLGMWLWKSASGKGRLLISLVIVGSGASIARSGSRGAFVGLGALVLAYLATARKVSVAQKMAVVVGMAVALVVAAPAGYWAQMGTLTELGQDYNMTAGQGRLQLIKRGLGYMVSHPVFGIGVGNFGRAEGTISSLAAGWEPWMAGIKWSAAHNTYIQAGAEMGIPGLLLFTALVVTCIVAPRKMRRAIPESWQSGTWEQQFLSQGVEFLPLAAIGFAVPAVFLSFAYLDPIYILAALTGGFVAMVTARTNARVVGARQDAGRAVIPTSLGPVPSLPYPAAAAPPMPAAGPSLAVPPMPAGRPSLTAPAVVRAPLRRP